MPVHNLNALINFAIEVMFFNLMFFKLMVFNLLDFNMFLYFCGKEKSKAPSGEAATALFIGTGLLGEGNS